MSDIFISYARANAGQAQMVAEALKVLGYGVWRDDELPAHRAYADVIEERLQAAKAVVVIWSAEAVKSEWVQSEADTARTDHKLVQLTVDGSKLPRPFDRIQCADLAGWTGDTEAQGWRKVVASIADLVGGADVATQPPAADAPLPLPSKPSIAVMPFANLSGDPDQEYFADGMVEEITNALSRFKSLFVIASSSTLSFKGNAVGAQQAARQLGVRYVLEGSVRKAGNRVRIAAQLIDGADGSQIWTNRFDDTLQDVFELQDKVALGVAGVIEPTVTSAETRRAAKRPTENMGSYDLYLRAATLQRSSTRAGVLEALDLVDRAIVLDPDYGPALALAASCRHIIVLYGWSDEPESLRGQAIELAHRALKVAGDDTEVLARVAIVVAYRENDLDAAVALAERAIAMNPGSAFAWAVSGSVLTGAGATGRAVEHIQTSIRLDPLGPNRGTQMAFMSIARFQEGLFGEAVAFLKECLQSAEQPAAFAFLAASYGHLGQLAEAQRALTRYRELSSTPIETFYPSGLPDEHRQLFLEGIALAEGKSPAATDAKAE